MILIYLSNSDFGPGFWRLQSDRPEKRKGIRKTKQPIRKNKPPQRPIISPDLRLEAMKKRADAMNSTHPHIRQILSILFKSLWVIEWREIHRKFNGFQAVSPIARITAVGLIMSFLGRWLYFFIHRGTWNL